MLAILDKHPALKWAIPAVLATGIAIVAAYVGYVRAINSPWVPFPLSLVLTEECADVFFLKLDILNVPCLKVTIAKGLGYGIVLASAGLKLPVVKNVLQAKSALGMSTSSVALESIACACGFSAAIKKVNPFSLWGELLIIFVQNFVLLLLARHFSNGVDPSVLVLIGVLLFPIGALAAPIESDLLIGLSTLIAMASRLPQIASNFNQKHTGVLSVITQALQVLGNVARLGTVAVETGDRAQIGSYLVALALNLVLLGQVVIYWNNTQAELAKSSKRKDQ